MQLCVEPQHGNGWEGEWVSEQRKKGEMISFQSPGASAQNGSSGKGWSVRCSHPHAQLPLREVGGGLVISQHSWGTVRSCVGDGATGWGKLCSSSVQKLWGEKQACNIAWQHNYYNRVCFFLHCPTELFSPYGGASLFLTGSSCPFTRWLFLRRTLQLLCTAELRVGRAITGESRLRTGTACPGRGGTSLSGARREVSSSRWIFRCYLTGKLKASILFIFGGREVLMRAWSWRSPNGLYNAKSSPSVLPGHFRPDLSQLIVLLVWGVKDSFANALQSSSVFLLFSSPQGMAPTGKLLAAPHLQGFLHHNVPMPWAHPRDAMNTGRSKGQNLQKKRKKEIPTVGAKHLKQINHFCSLYLRKRQPTWFV